MPVDVRPSATRARTRTPGVDSRHSLSFGEHYDPANTDFGLLLACNEEFVAPGAGFAEHTHRDVEIVTWVVEGALEHTDAAGRRAVLRPGQAQLLSAGTGVTHAERNAGPEPLRFVQMWVVPDAPGGQPRDARIQVGAGQSGSGLVPVASGRPGHGAALRIGQRDAALYVARLEAGACVELPEAPYVHLFVACGSVHLAGAGRLGAGDAARISDVAGQRVTAAERAEVLVWEMHSALGG